MNQYPTLLTTAAAAKLLGIPPNTLRQWVYRGKIKQVYPGLFDPNDLTIIARKRGRKPKEQKK